MVAGMIGDTLQLRDVKPVFVSLVHSLRVVVLKRGADVALPAYEACAVTACWAQYIHVVLQAYGTETFTYQELAAD
jgi:hypothetical protein